MYDILLNEFVQKICIMKYVSSMEYEIETFLLLHTVSINFLPSCHAKYFSFQNALYWECLFIIYRLTLLTAVHCT